MKKINLLFRLIALLLGAVVATGASLYLGFATGLGPWMGPLLLLCVRLLVRAQPFEQSFRLVVVGGMGAAIATAVAFSFPTLFFVDAALWHSLMAQPLVFGAGAAGLIAVCGVLGQLLARRIGVVNDAVVPVVSPAVMALQAAWGGFTVRVNERLLLVGGIVAGVLVFFTSPLCIASGFFAGPALALPLLCGMVIRYGIGEQPERIGALVSGLLLGSVITALVRGGLRLSGAQQVRVSFAGMLPSCAEGVCLLLIGIVLFGSGLSALAAIVCVLVLIPVNLHLGHFAQMTGLAPYGRYMTLVMLLLLSLPGQAPVALILVCVIIGVVGAALVQGFFARQWGSLHGIAPASVERLLHGSLLLAAVVVPWGVWFLSTHYTLGVAPLIAHRGLSRALLMTAFSWHSSLVAIGVGLGCVLQLVRLNPFLLFGGLIMPYSMAVPLGIGSLCARWIAWRSEGEIVAVGLLIGDILLQIVRSVSLLIW